MPVNAGTLNSLPETLKLVLTVTDGSGCVHEIEVTKTEGEQAIIHIDGDNLKLMRRLALVQAVLTTFDNRLF